MCELFFMTIRSSLYTHFLSLRKSKITHRFWAFAQYIRAMCPALIYSPHNRHSFYIFLSTIIICCISSMLTANFPLHCCTRSSIACCPPVQHMKTENTAVYCYIITIFTTDLSAKRALYILLLLFARLYYTVYTLRFMSSHDTSSIYRWYMLGFPSKVSVLKHTFLLGLFLILRGYLTFFLLPTNTYISS